MDRLATSAQINLLTKMGYNPAQHPEAFASMQAADAAIKAAAVQQWQVPATEKQVAMCASIGAQLGWIPRDYAGAGKQFKRLQIDLALALDAYDSAAPMAKPVYAELLIAQVRQHITRPVKGADNRQRQRPDRSKPAEQKVETTEPVNSGSTTEAPF